MRFDTAGNPITELSITCGWCGGPTNTSGSCANGCESSTVVPTHQALDLAAENAVLKVEVERLRQQLLEVRTISGTTEANLHGEIRDRDAAIKALVEAGDRLTRYHYQAITHLEAWSEAKRAALRGGE